MKKAILDLATHQITGTGLIRILLNSERERGDSLPAKKDISFLCLVFSDATFQKGSREFAEYCGQWKAAVIVLFCHWKPASGEQV